MEIVLASASPRRRQLLEQVGLRFTVRPADIDETMNPAADPAEEVGRLSARKAAAVTAEPDTLVIAADTIVCMENRILGKPANEAQALKMLRSLSGRTHEVLTGVTVAGGGRTLTHVERTRVRFRPCRDEELRAYIATGEPMDKAGAYGIQGLAALFVEAIEGDYYNVVGLPLCALNGMLEQFGEFLLR